MGNINFARVMIGGLAAGLVINVSEFILNGVVLDEQWRDAMAALNKPMMDSVGAMVGFNIAGFMTGIFLVWLYSAIRPRYGVGLRTGMLAGLAVWFIGYLLPLVSLAMMQLLPPSLLVLSCAWGFVETLLAGAVGAKLYREEEFAEELTAAPTR